ncbi:MAG: universal stress protein [Dehalococcoidia bacterium]|nr:universal stress protein [Dehalococcoidia bacterium]
MYDRIVVPLDGSPLAECVVPHIEALAKSPECEVQLVTVVEPVDIPTKGKIALSDEDLQQIYKDQEKDAHTYLNQIIDRLSKSDIQTRPLILRGKPAETLVEYIYNNSIDLLIMATHGRSGITKLFWGSIAEKVIRAVNIPVLLVKADPCRGQQE